MELCTTLRKEKEEVEQASARLKTIVTKTMTTVTEEEYRVDLPFKEGLTKVKTMV